MADEGQITLKVKSTKQEAQVEFTISTSATIKEFKVSLTLVGAGPFVYNMDTTYKVYYCSCSQSKGISSIPPPCA